MKIFSRSIFSVRVIAIVPFSSQKVQYYQ